MTSCGPVTDPKQKRKKPIAELAHPYKNRYKREEREKQKDKNRLKHAAVPQPPCRFVNIKNNLSLSFAKTF